MKNILIEKQKENQKKWMDSKLWNKFCQLSELYMQLYMDVEIQEVGNASLSFTFFFDKRYTFLVLRGGICSGKMKIFGEALS